METKSTQCRVPGTTSLGFLIHGNFCCRESRLWLPIFLGTDVSERRSPSQALNFRRIQVFVKPLTKFIQYRRLRLAVDRRSLNLNRRSSRELKTPKSGLPCLKGVTPFFNIANPRHNEIALFEISLYSNCFMVPTAAKKEHVISALTKYRL